MSGRIYAQEFSLERNCDAVGAREREGMPTPWDRLHRIGQKKCPVMPR